MDCRRSTDVDAVEACLDWAGMTPDQLIGIEPVRERAITAEKLAINAVMAGCLPMHFRGCGGHDRSAAAGVFTAWVVRQHRRLRYVDRAERSNSSRDRRKFDVQRSR